MIIDVELVLHEVRGEDDHLFAGIEHGLQRGIEGAGGAAGHHDLGPGYGQAGLLGEDLGHGGAAFVVPGVVHVTMDAGRRGLGKC